MGEKIIEIEVTKSGLPALWETGGGRENSGDARIVTGTKGEALRPVYVRTSGQRANSYHALLAIREGCYDVRAYRQRDDVKIEVYRITVINKATKTAEAALVNSFDEGEWRSPLDKFLVAAVEAAIRKSRMYHCQDPVYVRWATGV